MSKVIARVLKRSVIKFDMLIKLYILLAIYYNYFLGYTGLHVIIQVKSRIIRDAVIELKELFGWRERESGASGGTKWYSLLIEPKRQPRKNKIDKES